MTASRYIVVRWFSSQFVTRADLFDGIWLVLAAREPGLAGAMLMLCTLMPSGELAVL